MHDPVRPWLPCPINDTRVWCWWLGDRISGSIISRQQVALAKQRQYRPLFDSSLGGFVVSPEAVQLNCAYRQDASTQSEHTSCIPFHQGTTGASTSTKATCRPGCSWDGAEPVWCRDLRDFSGCAWPPEQLAHMLQQQYEYHGGYNEVVFNVSAWISHLPRTIEAVFIQPSDGFTAPAVAIMNEAKARRTWTLLRQEYGLSEAELPLLKFEPYPGARAYDDREYVPAFLDISAGAQAWMDTHAGLLERAEKEGLSTVG